MLTGVAIYKILQRQGNSKSTSIICSWFWLYNPLPMTVSSRGNAESILTLLVLLTIYCFMTKRLKSAAVLYAVSVHMKIYPVTYSLPIYLYLSATNQPLEMRLTNAKDALVKWFYPNKDRIRFVLITVTVFSILTGICYYL